MSVVKCQPHIIVCCFTSLVHCNINYIVRITYRVFARLCFYYSYDHLYQRRVKYALATDGLLLDFAATYVLCFCYC